jgi:hypothetical protein
MTRYHPGKSSVNKPGHSSKNRHAGPERFSRFASPVTVVCLLAAAAVAAGWLLRLLAADCLTEPFAVGCGLLDAAVLPAGLSLVIRQ